MCKDPNCEFCIECQHCHHKADEHMAGDIESCICYVCQKEGLDNCKEFCGFCRGKCKGEHYISPATIGY